MRKRSLKLYAMPVASVPRSSHSVANTERMRLFSLALNWFRLSIRPNKQHISNLRLAFYRLVHIQATLLRYGYKDQPKELLDHAKKSAHAGRYTSVNLTNKNTIEFRIFRGTLKYNTLIATLQLLDRICDVALFMSDEQVKAMSWTTFVSGCTQCPASSCAYVP